MIRVMAWTRLVVRGKQFHPSHAVFDFPVEPAALAIKAVRSEADVRIRGKPGAGAAGRPEPFFCEGHQLPADAISFEFRKHRDDPELASSTISYAKPDDSAIASAQPALVGSGEFLGDTFFRDTKAFEFLQGISILSRSRADVEQRRDVCCGDYPEVHERRRFNGCARRQVLASQPRDRYPPGTEH